MLKSFKVMLVPNKRQRTRLFQFAGMVRFAYNWALRKEINAYEAGEKFLSNNDLRKEFTVLRNSAEYAWLKTISNNVTKQAIKDCVDAYTNFFKGLSERPRFKSKRRGDFKFYQDTDKIRITATHVKLESIAKSKKHNKQGFNWFLSVAVEFEPEKSQAVGEPLGIDLGIKNLAVCSDGTVYPNINKTKTVRRLKKKQRRLQRSVSRKYNMKKKEGERYWKTRNIVKSERKLLRIYHRLADIRQNYRHQITSEIIRRKPSLIVLEDLNVRGIMSNRHLAKAVQEMGFYEFRRQIEYKTAWAGLDVVIADRYYPSSKTCTACGYVKKNLHLSERIYHCEVCGNEIDRDLQAAINLKRYAS